MKKTIQKSKKLSLNNQYQGIEQHCEVQNFTPSHWYTIFNMFLQTEVCYCFVTATESAFCIEKKQVKISDVFELF
jgi:hypothetical protein